MTPTNATALEPIREQDDLFHPPGDDPYFNESGWFSVFVPEAKIHGWLYAWHRPNMKLSLGGAALWDASGSEAHNCLFYDWSHFSPMQEGSQRFDFTLANSLRVECLKPLDSYRLHYDNKGATFDLEYNALLPVVNLHNCREGVDAWATGHYEQASKVTGTITLHGKTYEVDCLSNRDNSWGRRNSEDSWARGGVDWANASAESSFNVTSLQSLLRDDDPVFNTTEVPCYGWYVRDGVLSPIAEGKGKRVVTERGPDGRPLRIVVDAVDELGRELHAEGRAENVFNYHMLWFCYWCAFTWEWDGNTAWGETQDYMPLSVARRAQRAALR